MKNKKSLLLIYLVFNYIINSQNIYLDPINGKVNFSGSLKSPLSSLELSLKKINLNKVDTIFLLSGFHGNNILLKKNNSKNIVITAFKDSKPIISNLEIEGSNIEISKVYFYPNGYDISKYLLHKNFDNGTLLLINKNSNNIVIKDSYFYSTENSDDWELADWRKNVVSGINDFGINNKVINNKFYNIAFAIEFANTAKYSQVINNHIENFSGDGIRISSADSILVKGNKIINSVELDEDPIVGNHEDGIQAWVLPDDEDGIHGLVVDGNYIQNYSSFKKFKGILQGIGFFDGPYHNCKFTNNIIVVEHAHGIALYGAVNCEVLNNTVFPFPNTFPYKLGPPWIMITSTKKGFKSFDNIVANNLTTDLIMESENSIVKNNVVNCVAFKLIKDYEKFDFSPKPNFKYQEKKIIDAGSNEYFSEFDFNGIKREKDKVDIGAIELIEK
ncbi:MAG: right-handed parallel beta-helix repeat-containing protein [Melioribacteraceae bacterium]|nr:right-handed parallel beta-helix repeat-containing protein [Melioribacteraceae bacterium]